MQFSRQFFPFFYQMIGKNFLPGLYFYFFQPRGIYLCRDICMKYAKVVSKMNNKRLKIGFLC